MKEVKKGKFVKKVDLDSGAKLIPVYNAAGGFALIKGRLCFYDTKWKTIY